MSQCAINDLMTDARCLYVLPPGLLDSITVQLWCDAIAALAVQLDANVAVQNVDDGLWYRLAVVVPEPGAALLWFIQTPTTPGVNPYLVLTNTDDGLKYKLQAAGSPPAVTWQIDTTPTGEAETPTTVLHGATTYTLSLANSGPVPVLTPV